MAPPFGFTRDGSRSRVRTTASACAANASFSSHADTSPAALARAGIASTGPIPAVRKLLAKTGLSLKDIDVVELNEAFASQAVYVQRTLEIPDAKLNVHGGAIALGHPLGCTGAKLTATALYELKRRGGRYAIVTMCIGGGQGAAGLFEAAR